MIKLRLLLAVSGGCLPPLRCRAFTPEDIFNEKKTRMGDTA
jgi:hypothetical protein